VGDDLNKLDQADKEKWIEAIKKSNDPDKLIAMISTKYTVSDKQKETIRSWA
jgi:hypothetical protein